MAAARLVWIIESASATDTAAHLIKQAGGIGAAHAAVTRAAKRAKKDSSRPRIIDGHWLLIADSIQRRDKCSDNAALTKVAALCFKADAVDERAGMVRRLRSRLAGGTLAATAAALDGYGMVNVGK